MQEIKKKTEDLINFIKQYTITHSDSIPVEAESILMNEIKHLLFTFYQA